MTDKSVFNHHGFDPDRFEELVKAHGQGGPTYRGACLGYNLVITGDSHTEAASIVASRGLTTKGHRNDPLLGVVKFEDLPQEPG